MEWFKKNWGVIAVIVVILLLLDKCGNGLVGTFIGGDEVISEDTTSTYKMGNPFVVVVPTEKVVYRDRDFHHYHTDTVYNTDSSDFSVGFMYQKKDSILDATIGVWAKERPDSISLEYSALIPEVYRVDTVVNTITKKVRTTQLYLGPEAVVYPNFKGGFVAADLVSKKGWQVEVGVGYGWVNDNAGIMGKVAWKPLISFRKRK